MSEDLHIGKADLAESLVGIHGNGLALSRRHAKFVVDQLCQTIADNLLEGKTVHLPGIGGIRQRRIAPRSGTVPGTYAAFTTPASFGLAIRTAAQMKRRLNPDDPAAAAAPDDDGEADADAVGAP